MKMEIPSELESIVKDIEVEISEKNERKVS